MFMVSVLEAGGKPDTDPAPVHQVVLAMLFSCIAHSFSLPLCLSIPFSLYFLSLEACVQHIRMSSMYPPVERQEL